MPDSNSQIRWLIVILSVVCLFASILLYFYLSPEETTLIHLVLAALPSIVVILVAVPIVYFIFERQGIDYRNTKSSTIDVNELSQKLASHLNTAQKSSPIVSAFYEKYRHVDWKDILNSATDTIDIMAYYYDSWVNQNYEEIVAFFSRPGTRMRVFVSNPNDEFILANVQRLFPEYPKEEVAQKISRTGSRMFDALTEAGGHPDRLEFYYVPHLLNYSAQVINNSYLVLSIFEMYRTTKIDSPTIIINLKESEHIRKYWHKEREGLMNCAEKQDLAHNN